MDQSKSVFSQAVQLVGGQTEMARLLGVRQGQVWAWINRNRGPFPAERCADVERATGGSVTKHDLRPDIFGPSPEKRAA
jgi:DNA-binding transcriptional regulator YdaS (Cro superfamily)